MPTFDPPPSPGTFTPVVAITDNLIGVANRVTGSIVYSLVFNESVSGLEVNDFTITNGTISSVSGGGTSWSVTITPALDIAAGTIGLTLKAGAVSDVDGNVNASATDSRQAIDTVGPTAIFSPVPGAVGVSTTANIVVTFSEAIALGAGSILLKNAAGGVIESYDVATSTGLSVFGSTLTVNPTKDLGIFTGYTVEIAPGAIKDLGENSFAGLPGYNFKTTTVDGLYNFFVVAFNAAPGVEYMNQLAEAYNYGLTVSDIVNIFTTKSQFTSSYPETLTHAQLATSLVSNIVKNSASDAIKAGAVADITAALDIGWSVGKMIYQVFGNVAAKALDDPIWGATAKQFHNELAVARYYTEVMGQNTTDLPTLRSVIASVDQNTDVSTPELIAALIGVATAHAA